MLGELGVALGLLTADGQSLIVAGALISIVLNCFLVHGAAKAEQRVDSLARPG